jgi:nicotinamide-nucleotide amidase
VDSNSMFISNLLAECGIDVRKKIAVGDYKGEIQDALRSSLKRADVIVLTGGLGSTIDDCTREAVAEMFRRPLTRRKKAYQELQDRFRRLRRPITPLLAKQALIPSGSTLLANTVGTASGFLLRQGHAVIVALPGVPREAKLMMTLQVQPIIRKLYKSTRQYWFHAFNTFGLSEIDIQAQLGPLLGKNDSIQFGLLASPMGVKVTVSCWRTLGFPSAVKKKTMFSVEWEQLINRVRHCLVPWLYSEGEQTMEEIVGESLRGCSWSIALAESCTGGLVVHRLTEVPGSSLYLDRGIVSYSNQSKRETIGVPASILRRYGAVSSQVATTMAKGIRKSSGVDVGVGVTGIAGPGGGTLNKPVGLVYCAIDGPRGSQCLRWQFGGSRSEIKLKTSQAVLNLIRCYADYGTS